MGGVTPDGPECIIKQGAKFSDLIMGVYETQVVDLSSCTTLHLKSLMQVLLE